MTSKAPTTGAPTDRGEHSRRAILDAALPVFRTDGYAAASLNQIIEASGLTKGGFYFHFPSKQALALAVLADHQERAVARVRQEIGSHERAVDRLFATPRVIARHTEAGDGPAALRKLTEELARDPDLRDVVCGSIRVWIEDAAKQFRAAQAEGSVRDDIDAATFAEVAANCDWHFGQVILLGAEFPACNELAYRMGAPLVTPSGFDPAVCPLIVGVRPLVADKTWTGIVGRLASESIGLVLTLEHPAEAHPPLTADVVGVLTDAGTRRERAPNPVQAVSEARNAGARLAGRRLRPI